MSLVDEIALAGTLIYLLQGMMRLTTPILLAALGETITERAGVLNIGIEGIMLMGAFAGFAGTALYGTPWAGLLAAIVVGIAIALLFALFCVTLKSDQIVVGVAVNMLALGLTGFLYRRFFTHVADPISSVSTFPTIKIPILSEVPAIGIILFTQNILVYLSLCLVPVLWFILYKTSMGITLISTGEHPKAADSLGINVFKVRYLAIIVGGVLASIGGAFLSIAHSNTFIEGMTGGKGFIALAVVILGKWNPLGVLGGALVFGGASSLQLLIQSTGAKVPYDLVLMIPYILTVVAVVLVAKRKVGAPSALTIPYEKS